MQYIKASSKSLAQEHFVFYVQFFYKTVEHTQRQKSFMKNFLVTVASNKYSSHMM